MERDIKFKFGSGALLALTLLSGCQASSQEAGGPIEISLGSGLALSLALKDGGLRGAALGIAVPPGALEDGTFRVTGHAPLVQAEDWERFITTYFASGWAEAPGDDARDQAGARSQQHHEPRQGAVSHGQYRASPGAGSGGHWPDRIVEGLRSGAVLERSGKGHRLCPLRSGV